MKILRRTTLWRVKLFSCSSCSCPVVDLHDNSLANGKWHFDLNFHQSLPPPAPLPPTPLLLWTPGLLGKERAKPRLFARQRVRAAFAYSIIPLHSAYYFDNTKEHRLTFRYRYMASLPAACYFRHQLPFLKKGTSRFIQFSLVKLQGCRLKSRARCRLRVP